ncbi:hypothetical protein HELRODRAFT_161724 [Helobdella robusta]|uniref:Uncharacterized protein n=1 Tax=Helobdella robusta TaxID=6412 RepID=T1ERU2_HELRO|nr:hypothetical protein HELRODRAFT_161724 [Helobdella robusta]ESO02453.1 hypothetical protein HELRODRAFT_161724 [Helobdella robusta]
MGRFMNEVEVGRVRECLTDPEKRMAASRPVNCRTEKGSMTLRSTDHVYREGVYVHGWYPESYPKDHDFKWDCPRSLFRSTYQRFAEKDKPTPPSHYTATNDEMFRLKAQPLPACSHRNMLIPEESLCIMIDRELEVAKESNSCKNILPKHLKDPLKFYDLTTNVDTYRLQLPLIETKNEKQRKYEESQKEDLERTKFLSLCNRKPVSQFTDLDGRKRDGVNVWMDDSGVYFNTAYRMKNPVYYKFVSPYTERV